MRLGAGRGVGAQHSPRPPREAEAGGPPVRGLPAASASGRTPRAPRIGSAESGVGRKNEQTKECLRGGRQDVAWRTELEYPRTVPAGPSVRLGFLFGVLEPLCARVLILLNQEVSTNRWGVVA